MPNNKALQTITLQGFIIRHFYTITGCLQYAKKLVFIIDYYRVF